KSPSARSSLSRSARPPSFPHISSAQPLPALPQRAHFHWSGRRSPCAADPVPVGHPVSHPRRAEMRLKYALGLAAVGCALAWPNDAWAAYGGACSYPADCCSSEQCCMPRIRYRVSYQTVIEEQPCVCYRKVYRTVMKECRSTCYKKVCEQRYRECRYTVCKPVW